MAYDFSSVEKKWQKYWEAHPQGKALPPNFGKKKYYALSMFPYPSGSGLHVGHWRGYVLTDLYARMKMLQGYNVLQPMGWDAFGLPAENDAIKKGIKPQQGTATNIATFKEQLKEMGAAYDWSKELDTTDPNYYKWTQWIFLKMYEAGLAYSAQIAVNWCPSCLTGLANEEVVEGGCERCGAPVTTKEVSQWILRITKYADRLITGLENLDWPEKIKVMQRNWIGKSEGLIFSAPVKDSDLILQTFSAHFESFAADTFVVIAPDHPLLPTLLEGVANKDAILARCQDIINKRNLKDDQEIEGVFTGRYIHDPVGNGDLPIWVASFALAHYGTGIVKCSAHDERDFAFAKKYNIPLKAVLFPPNLELAEKVANFEICYTDMKKGILREPSLFAGQCAGEVREQIIEYCQKAGYAQRKTAYKLRDWIFSRQRYWGEPIPLIHCQRCGIVPVPEDQLPVKLPDIERYQPTGTGESPLAAIDEWVNTECPSCSGPAQRETNTMPQWAGSCWYFLRYPNPHLDTAPFSTEDLKYWLPVDLYVGGIEHAILHLLYARFYVKVLYDLGYVPFDEPFSQLFNQGMVTKYSEKSGLVEKMSKSKGNVVNPDEMVAQYGADALRLYIMFMGPPDLDAVWQDTGIEGMKRFLNRLWDYITTPTTLLSPEDSEDHITTRRFHRFLKEYYQRLDHFKPNTALSAAMEWLNDAIKNQMRLSPITIQSLLSALSLFAPYMASELLEQRLGIKLTTCTWPTYDSALADEPTFELVIQVNGKMRANLIIPKNMQRDDIEPLARDAVAKWLEEKQLIRVIFVPNHLINFVIR